MTNELSESEVLVLRAAGKLRSQLNKIGSPEAVRQKLVELQDGKTSRAFVMSARMRLIQSLQIDGKWPDEIVASAEIMLEKDIHELDPRARYEWWEETDRKRQIEVVASDYLRRVFAQALLEGDGVIPEDEDVLEVYREFSNVWRSDEFEWVASVPMQGLVCGFGWVRIGDWRLKYSTGDIEKLDSGRGLHALVGLDKYGDTMKCMAIAERIIAAKKGDTEVINRAAKSASWLVTSLRLVGLHAGCASVTLASSSKYAWTNFPNAYCFSTLALSQIDSHQYDSLDSHLLEQARNRYLQLSDGKNKKVARLDAGFRRFNLSHGRDQADDKILDLVIAIEASLLGDMEKIELRYRAAIRAANLLRDKYPGRRTFNAVRELYDLRSAIVHNGSTLERALVKKHGRHLDMQIRVPRFLRSARLLVAAIYKEMIDDDEQASLPEFLGRLDARAYS